ncbi:hypothetical protein KUTeg_020633 [Tegillarca granosa]|uniref:Uncharacterized protein n=1 Tax=Tegillarca granosa TaxID=220873 RepID=A0ABQ9ECU1_TEGGR|nr:hypothetical protein KUTeg_020633 [Tegillarca granosa]
MIVGSERAVLTYPELLKEELEDLNQMVQPKENEFAVSYLYKNVGSTSIDFNAEISDETLQQLKDLGLLDNKFLKNMSKKLKTHFAKELMSKQFKHMDGLGLNATKHARLAEITTLDGSIAITLAAHQAIGLKSATACHGKALVVIVCQQLQCESLAVIVSHWVSLLNKLLTGCETETLVSSDAASIQIRATLTEDGKNILSKWRENLDIKWLNS